MFFNSYIMLRIKLMLSIFVRTRKLTKFILKISGMLKFEELYI